MSNRAFIAKPEFYELPSLQLHYTDILTYIAIRSFLNAKNGQCFPSYETIAERMGASRGFVMESIKRLLAAKQLNILKSVKAHVSNRYQFKEIRELKKFDRIPYEIFDAADLSINEKAMLILLRQFNISLGMNIGYSINTIAERLGVSYKTVYTQLKSLIKKGYVTEPNTTIANKGSRLTGLKLSDKINWWYEDYMPKAEEVAQCADFSLGVLLIT